MPLTDAQRRAGRAFYARNKADHYAKARAWLKHNPEKVKACRKRYHEANKEKLNARCRNYYQRNKSAIIAKHIVDGSTPRGRFTHYKAGAKRRGIVFALTLKEFQTFWQRPCHYCGHEIGTIGLDRIKSELGYVLGNLVSCCWWCNIAKRERTVQEFIDNCCRVAEFSAPKIEA